MERIQFTGGSLSGTYLCRPTGATAFVRKEASLTVDREYGFQRWYSQLKRLQRYEQLFPGVFPSLIAYGMVHDTAYFDIEYIADAVTAHEFLIANPDRAAIDRFLAALLKIMAQLHEVKMPSTRDPIDLYIHEEIEQRVGACMEDEQFRAFVAPGSVIFNGERVPGLITVLDDYKRMARHHYRNTTESFTHGNLTLENILYQPTTNRVVFIDPYEENIIDSILAEYSQIYQSSNSLYEMYNAQSPVVEGNSVELRIRPCPGLSYFNDRFTEFVRNNHDDDDYIMIRLFEISQYARMLPFKMRINSDKMLFFYGLGSYLFHVLRDEARHG